jgi:molybdate transport system permease protein
VNWEAFWLTVRLAALVSALLLAMGIPIAYWLTYSRWRWKFLAEAVIALPIVLPPTVLGLYVLMALGTRSPIGRYWESLTGHTLAFTFEGLLIGSVLYSLPFTVQPLAASFSAVDPKLLRASASLGNENAYISPRVLPLQNRTGHRLCAPAAHARRNRRRVDGRETSRRTRTISIDIYDQCKLGTIPPANQTALVLLIISFLVLSVVYAMNRRGGTVGLWK